MTPQDSYLLSWLQTRVAGLRRASHWTVLGGGTLSHLLGLAPFASLLITAARCSLTDERCVPLDDVRRNQRVLAECLPTLVLHPIVDAQGAPLKTPLPVPDICLIGMGEDGHIASLFPGSSALVKAETADAITPILVDDAPDSLRRVSRSYAGLVGRLGTALVIRGTTKRALLDKVMAGKAPNLPVAHLLVRHPDIAIFNLP